MENNNQTFWNSQQVVDYVKEQLENNVPKVHSGIESVQTEEERNNIPIENRYLGMICYVQDEGRYFNLTEGLDNEYWQEFKTGGGGNIMPSIFEDEDYPSSQKIYHSKGDKVAIPIRWTSPNYGLGQLFTIVDGINSGVQKVAQGINTWDISNFILNGTHKYQCYVTDAAGLSTDVLTYTVVDGGLTISSEFDKYIDNTAITETTEIVFTLKVECGDTESNIVVNYELTNNETQEKVISRESIVNIGTNVFEFGTFSHGNYSLTLRATAGELKSTELSYDFDVLSGNEIRMLLTKFDKNFDTSTKISIPFRVTMYGQSRFYTDVVLDDRETERLNTNFGLNNWSIGKLAEGTHHIRMQSFTLDRNISSNVLEFDITVVKGVYNRVQPYMENLVAYYDADDMNNLSTTKNRWKNKIKGGAEDIKLFDLNYNSNGWINEDLPDGYSKNHLKFTGESYGTLEYRPFNRFDEQPGAGITVDILFRTRCTGDTDARVLSCTNSNSVSENGFWITTSSICMKPMGTNGLRVDYSEDEWTRATFLIDKSNSAEGPARYCIYVNGVISGVSLVAIEDSFNHSDIITFGAKPIGSLFKNFAQCEIRSFRIYNKALTSEQILQNHIADIVSDTEQEKKNILNYGTDGNNTLPIIRFNENNSTDGFSQLYKENSKKKKIECTVTYQPVDGDVVIWNNAQVSFQGTSTLAYAIKNFRLYFRDENDKSVKWAPPETTWKPEKLVTLKCDYMDSSHRNNTGLANVIPKLYKTQIPPQKYVKECRTTIDGFPCLLYENDVLIGTFMFNLDKSANTNFGFNLKDEEGNLIFPECKSYEVTANSDTSAGAFCKYDMESIIHDFEVRYAVDEDTAQNNPVELQRLIKFVCDSTDAEFKANFSNYLDLDYTIGYYIAVMTFGMVDNFGKNMMINTWDGKIWYPTLYDMDTCFGLNNSGEEKFDSDIELTSDEEYTENIMNNEQLPIRKKAFNTSGSKLWRKLRRVFDKEIKQRYAELRRSGIISYKQLCEDLVTNLTDKIGERYYNYNAKKKYFEHTGYLYMCHGNRTEKFKKWIKERIIFLDTIMDYTGENGEKIDIRVNKSGESRLIVRTYSPMYVNIEYMKNTFTGPKYCSPTATFIDTDSDGNEVERLGTEFKFNINAATDQEFYISCAKHVLSVDGIYDLVPSKVDIQYAEKLTDLDIRGSSYITQMFLGNNKYLTDLNCSNCINLGTVISNIDVSKCINLKSFNISNTKLTSVSFPVGGALKEINLTNSPISTLELEGLENLEILKLDNCEQLGSLIIKECNKLPSIALIRSAITIFKAISCKGLKTINLEGNNGLTSYEILGCSELTTLILKQISNSVVENINLATMYNLEYLDVSGCTYLNNIIFPKYESEEETLKVADMESKGIAYEGKRWHNLKTLYLGSSGITTCQYGYPKDTDPEPTYLDMQYLDKLQHFNMSGASNVLDIRNLNITCSEANNMFQSCLKLRHIHGEIKVTYNLQYMFSWCQSLQTLDDLEMDFKEVERAQGVFSESGANGITMDGAKRFMKALGPNLKYASNMFFNCLNLKGEVPSDFFATCPNIIVADWLFRGSGITRVGADVSKNLTKVTSMQRTFRDCVSLSYVDPRFFNNLESIQSFYRTFYGCPKLVTCIDKNSFDDSPNINSMEAMFTDCPKLTVTDFTGMFDNCQVLTTTKGMFLGCKTLIMSTFPEGMFAKCTNLVNTENMFGDCTSLTCAPPDCLFYKKEGTTEYKASKVASCGSMFGGSKLTGRVKRTIFKGASALRKLGSESVQTNEWDTNTYWWNGGVFENTNIEFYDTEIFEECPNITTVAQFFSGTPLKGCYVDGTLSRNCIPSKIFAKTKGLSDVSYFFRNCTALSGKIPSDLFTSCKSLQSTRGFLKGCNSFTGKDADTMQRVGIPESLFNGLTSLSNVSEMFDGCASFEFSIPENLFSQNPNLVNAYKLFNDCTSSFGTIPNSLFQPCKKKIQNIYGAFCNCTELEGEIPNNILKGLEVLSDCSWLFSGCEKLEGSIDSTFFADAVLLKNINNTFQNCKKITTEAGEAFAIPQELLFNNPFIINADYLFQGCSLLEGTFPYRLFFKQEALLKANYCFSGCDKITGTVDNDFMKNCTKLQSTSYMFYGCTGITGIGNKLFAENKKIQNVHAMFRGCSNLTGMSPQWWRTHPTITDGNSCFSGCTKLTNHPSNSASSTLQTDEVIPTLWATGY